MNASTPKREDLPQRPKTTRRKGLLGIHWHPITVHFPNGLVPVSFLFFVLSLVAPKVGLDRVQVEALELSGYWTLIIAVVAMPVVLVSGWRDWRAKYRASRTALFRRKIRAALLSGCLIAVLMVWRSAEPEVVAAAAPERWVFLALLAAAGVLGGQSGHLGGKLVHG